MDYNKNAEYDKKSMAELVAIRTQFELAIANQETGLNMFNEHLQWVNMKIAERIGKK